MSGDVAGGARRVPRAVRRRRRSGRRADRPRRLHPSRDAAASSCRRPPTIASLTRGRARARRANSPSSCRCASLSRTWQMLLKGIPEVQAVEPARQRRRDGADPPRPCRRPADARRGAEIAGRRAVRQAPPRGRPRPAPRRRRRGNGASARRAARAPVDIGRRRRRCGWSKPTVPRRNARACGSAAAARRRKPPPAVPVKSLEDIAALADANRDMLFKIALKQYVRLVRIEPGRLEVSLTGDAPKTLLGDLTTRLQELDRPAAGWSRCRARRAADARRGGSAPTRERRDPRRPAAIRSSPAILSRFPGATIIDVRIPDAPRGRRSEADMPRRSAASTRRRTTTKPISDRRRP